MTPASAMVAKAFRCLESDHTFHKHVSRTSPRSMQQTATCPEHHCAAIAIDAPPGPDTSHIESRENPNAERAL